MLGQYMGSEELTSKTVWYSGADTLKEGYVLCYDPTLDPLSTDPKTRKGNVVIKPTTASLNCVAGFVCPQSAGKVGPCFVDIFVPRRNSLVKAFTHANMTKETTGLVAANGQYYLVADADATFNFQNVGLAAETSDTSTTSANKFVWFK